MNHIDIVIPTRNRLSKLIDTINTIPECNFITIVVICDGDNETFKYISNNKITKNDFLPLLSPAHCGSVACKNSYISIAEDGVLYLTDDVELDPYLIPEACALFNAEFPDDDGVLGIEQDKDHHPCGVGLVGREFINRYPNRFLFYPRYYHFACFEIMWHAKKIHRFAYMKNIKEHTWVKHRHPCYYPEEMDQTHVEARKFHKEDVALKNERIKSGKIWGYNDDQCLR